MVLIYFTVDGYRNYIMFVSYDRRNDRILYSSDENLFHDRLWSFNGIMQDSCSMIMSKIFQD